MTRSSLRFISAGLWLFLLAIGLLLTNLAAPRSVHAANLSAGTYAGLVTAINQANTLAGDDTITLTADITLTGLLPNITSNITFQGASHTIDGNNTYQIFFVTNTAVVNINNLTFTRGNVTSDTLAIAGGAIFNDNGTINVTNTTFSNNVAAVAGIDPLIVRISAGGAIFNQGGSLNLVNTTFTNNLVSVSGTITIISLSAGGAIANLGGEVVVSNSTFSNNQASVSGLGIISISLGGAIANAGGLDISNSTFSNNIASAASGGSSAGGAIGNFLGLTTINNATFFNNSATASGGGSAAGWTLANLGGGLEVRNSIVVDPSGGNNCAGPVTDKGFNLQYPDNSCGASIPVLDPKLDPAGLKSNGGPTRTIALQSTSPAINRIPLAGCPPTDQRYFGRQGLCDIGAYEFRPNDQEPPADLIGQLRETPDRVAANDSENLIRYTFTVKNVGQGTARAISLNLPVDPQLVIGYTEFNDPRLWVSTVTTDSVIVGLPLLANNDVVSGTIFFRPNPAPAPAAGSKVFTRYNLKWTNPAGDDKLVWSNAVSFNFGEPGSNLDISGGQVQLMTSDGPVANSTKMIYYSNFWIPNEPVSTWLTRPDGTSVALTQGNASAEGKYAVEVDASGLAAGTYVVAAFGQRSEEYGSGLLVVGTSGDSQAKLATSLGLKALGAKALLAPTSR